MSLVDDVSDAFDVSYNNSYIFVLEEATGPFFVLLLVLQPSLQYMPH